MIGKFSIAAVGVLIISFGIFGLLSAAEKSGLPQSQVVLRGVPYLLVLISGYGVVGRQDWARMMIVAISILGLALQVFEISMSLNFKDMAEALLFMFFILFFISKPIKAEFNR
ncbi:MAG TPA: hypothetical protein VE439_10420 [Anaerolineae bacterium]|nr:hypothetical protein [Anaerolineae bacterium]